MESLNCGQKLSSTGQNVVKSNRLQNCNGEVINENVTRDVMKTSSVRKEVVTQRGRGKLQDCEEVRDVVDCQTNWV